MTRQLWTDDFKHKRWLERAPIGEVGIEVDIDVEVLFVFADRLCRKLDTSESVNNFKVFA